ncbi:MAG: hypothetical protein KA715_04120 [Xanthomonadaceae bacterium]|nr:hypothetical protein [Xanthomonadaceae bacterium]
MSYADISTRNQKSAYSTDLNLHQLPHLSEKFLRLTQKDDQPREYKFIGLRILTQGGMYKVPGLLFRDLGATYVPVGGVTGALVFGGELGYVKRPWGASFILDIASVGLPIAGSNSVSSQFSYKFAAHYYSTWFQKPTRFSFIFMPLTALVARYDLLNLTHSGMGVSFEAQIEGPQWRETLLNWVFSLNWNRIAWTRASFVPPNVPANYSSGELTGSSAEMIYALIGMEMNFSVR